MNRFALSIPVAVAAALTLAVAGPAAAAPAGSGPQTVSHYVIPSGDFDPEFCSFPLIQNGTDAVTELDYSDSDGNLTQQVFHDQETATVANPANGITLSVEEHATITVDFVNETETWSGVAERFSYPDGSIVAQDTGQIVFAGDDSIASESGSNHSIAEGPGLAAVCSILSGT